MTNHECLRQLGDLPMFSLASPRTWRDVRTASEWAQEGSPEEGYEIREERYDYGRRSRTVVGLVGGPTIYREAR